MHDMKATALCVAHMTVHACPDYTIAATFFS